MLTQKEILNEVFTLPIAKQREIAVEIQNHINEKFQNKTNDLNGIEANRELTVEERIAVTKSLSGCLKPEGEYIPMTKEEDRELIEEYLLEKYS